MLYQPLVDAMVPSGDYHQYRTVARDNFVRDSLGAKDLDADELLTILNADQQVTFLNIKQSEHPWLYGQLRKYIETLEVTFSRISYTMTRRIYDSPSGIVRSKVLNTKKIIDLHTEPMMTWDLIKVDEELTEEYLATLDLRHMPPTFQNTRDKLYAFKDGRFIGFIECRLNGHLNLLKF